MRKEGTGLSILNLGTGSRQVFKFTPLLVYLKGETRYPLDMKLGCFGADRWKREKYVPLPGTEAQLSAYSLVIMLKKQF
jgi:hypothetical protein